MQRRNELMLLILPGPFCASIAYSLSVKGPVPRVRARNRPTCQLAKPDEGLDAVLLGVPHLATVSSFHLQKKGQGFADYGTGANALSLRSLFNRLSGVPVGDHGPVGLFLHDLTSGHRFPLMAPIVA